MTAVLNAVDDSETGKPPELVERRSAAAKVWLLIVVLVLLSLWLQMRGNQSTSYNFIASGSSTVLGADVWIDGQHRGKMLQEETSGLGGAVFYAHLSGGRHRIEIKKPGYEPFSQEISLDGEGYFNVELTPDR